MNYVSRFLGFGHNGAVTGLFGLGGPNLKVEPPFLFSVFLAWQVTLYLIVHLDKYELKRSTIKIMNNIVHLMHEYE